MASISETEPLPTDLATRPEHPVAPGWVINVLHVRVNGNQDPAAWADRFQHAADLGFTHVCLGYATPLGGTTDLRSYLEHDRQAESTIARAVEAASRAGLGLLLDVTPLPAGGQPPSLAEPQAVSHLDPRISNPWSMPRRPSGASAQSAEWWAERLRGMVNLGAAGFRCLDLDATPPVFWHQVREAVPRSILLAWVPQNNDMPHRIAGLGFDLACSEISPWDVATARYIASQAALSTVAPTLVAVDAVSLSQVNGDRRRLDLDVAASTAVGLFLAADGQPPSALQEVASALKLTRTLSGRRYWKPVTPPNSRVLAMVRGSDPALETDVTLIAVNTDLNQPAPPPISLDPLPVSAGPALSVAEPPPSALQPGEIRLVPVQRNAEVLGGYELELTRAWAESGRIVIEAIEPSVEDGLFPAKTIIGRAMEVTADILTDGHIAIAADLLWRPRNTDGWQRVPMRKELNDVWRGSLTPRNIGMHGFMIEAWIDEWEFFAHGLKEKLRAGVPVDVEVAEGRNLIETVNARADGRLSAWLNASVEEMLSADLSHLMREYAERPCLARSKEHLFRVDRPAAEFASWYELFPRSATPDRARHGTFRSVKSRLPQIRYMGFDVLYFPPIHPIGMKNRKGRNNSLKAEPGDVGSPYAIGSEAGGHDALHPDLGTLDDFHDLIAAARDHGLEIAMDFAIQCSPDHPWVREHPEWFSWRPDGTIRYAENPPKKYEDIVNPDFYKAESFPGLWLALRDVIQYWVDQGIRIFRVDNPHTKPLPFWQWMIADIQARRSDVIFLAEAFTRPKLMYRLGQVGFTQSYTYFTWRNTKQELTEYMLELSRPPVSDFYRPNFFVNTPDINPYYLQTSGRPGFLVRAALAATLSGLWGMYSGYEICESAPLPGREEYLDSEKYEIRPRDYNAPGNIVAEIARLNLLRRLYPPLRTHLGVMFFEVRNDNVILYGKRDQVDGSMILVAVNLDPHNVQSAVIEVPLWMFGLRDDERIGVTDLWRDVSFTWFGKWQQITLDPHDLPFAIWRLERLP